MLPIIVVSSLYITAFLLAMVGGRWADEDWKKERAKRLREKRRKRKERKAR